MLEFRDGQLWILPIGVVMRPIAKPLGCSTAMAGASSARPARAVFVRSPLLPINLFTSSPLCEKCMKVDVSSMKKTRRAGWKPVPLSINKKKSDGWGLMAENIKRSLTYWYTYAVGKKFCEKVCTFQKLAVSLQHEKRNWQMVHGCSKIYSYSRAAYSNIWWHGGLCVYYHLRLNKRCGNFYFGSIHHS